MLRVSICKLAEPGPQAEGMFRAQGCTILDYTSLRALRLCKSNVYVCLHVVGVLCCQHLSICYSICFAL